ncbi:uncharacterized protein LOC129277432 [Lytechinus pictus]|uniref:uncharacterized protein LOC129277432 n=1 Tax=Lytechinus pictus TaxID=7653 RepID=UPI0030B9F1F3
MEELPKAFVSSLRVLFEILDEDSDGYVELAEIEKRWQGNSVTGLPAGVVDSLRGIAPKGGRLSFERFCSGLKITLEKNRASSKGRQVQVRGSRHSKDEKQLTTATVRPNNVVHPMRAKSAPQLHDVPTKPVRQMRNSRSSTSALPDEKKTIDPPDYAAHMQKTKEKSRKQSEKSDEIYSKSQSQTDAGANPSLADRKRVEATIKSWQQEKRQSSSQFQRQPDVIYARKQDVNMYAKPPQQSFPGPGETSKQHAESHYEKPVRRTSESTQKAGGRRKKDEPRRHTLSNGIDYNMVRINFFDIICVSQNCFVTY